MTQYDEAATQASDETGDGGAAEHPAGRISLGSTGGLGARSRLLSVSEGETGYSHDLPWTTMTSPF
ncbi:hypothetical protein CIB93_08665 [Streptomyces sp. WZ.A104]|uniref:Uncharacterized protein n=1 Tax=Streptomyces durocortorensis TaxID=2811104 RepID=A0ABY9VT67_9ACTN|nr:MULTISPECIES: hypothetical protein [Streptomyces]PCG86551.1 hypothetical protein CIB93_08665 [Streptomyces sp. WZ.A104]WNF27124.1 hypothetical protein RI138_09885 [Streptomyces durocortorensis]